MPNPQPATVTLDQTTTPWTLVVNPSDISVSQNAITTRIVWQLSGMPAGFGWPGNPPPGSVFGGGQANGTSLAVNDAHVGASTNGTFPYQLCVTDGNGNYYYTSAVLSPTAKPAKAPKVTNN